MAGTGAAVAIEQLSATGAVLSSVTQLASVAGDRLFHSTTGTVTSGIAQARVRLGGRPRQSLPGCNDV